MVSTLHFVTIGMVQALQFQILVSSLSRLICSMTNDKTASLTAVLAFMMPRTFEALVPTEWVNIYTWLGFQYAMRYRKQEQLKAMKEIAPRELSDYEKELLDNLHQWIYDKRRQPLKTIMKDNKISKSDWIPVVQEKLFR